MTLVRNVCTAGIAAVAVVLLYSICWRPYRANILLRDLQSSTKIAAAMPSSPEQAELVRRNVRAARLALTNTPVDRDLWMIMGANQRIVSNAVAAVAAYRKALTYGPRPEIYFELANAENAAGERKHAVADLMLAAEFDPAMIIDTEDYALREEVLKEYQTVLPRSGVAVLYIGFATAYLANGDFAEAKGVAVRAALLDPSTLTRPEFMAYGDPIVHVTLDELARVKHRVPRFAARAGRL